MSKVRNLPAKSTLDPNDLFYIIDSTSGSNAGRKITTANVKSAISLTAAEVKALYESNTNTNEFSDAEKAKLATVETGATADQNAAEVPYDNSNSNLSASNAQAAIDEVADLADGGFSVGIVSGLIAHYSAGKVRFQDSHYDVLSGDILLNPNITLGEIYADTDGVVKQTGSGGKTPPLATPIALFSTNLTSILSLSSIRVRSNSNLIKGASGEITSVNPDGTADAGATNKYADAGHKHTIPTATAVGLDADSSNSAGTADSLSRADHTHDLATGAPSSQAPDQANAEGSSANLARADHIHNIPTDAPATTLSPATTNAEGVGSSFARNDHSHAIATALVADISTIAPDDAASAGVADTFARGDHKHAIATDVAVGLDAASTNTEGVSTSFARADHTHDLSTGAPSSQAPDQANAEGSSANLARADHVHNIPAAAPTTTLSPATTNAEGVGSSFARNDHTHAVATGLVGDITTIQPDATAAAGTADRFARADHRHAIDAAAPSNTGTANAEGASTSFARADHVHNTVIANTEIANTTLFTTSSTTDVVITSLTNTPAAGTYAVFVNVSGVFGDNNRNSTLSIYSGGSQIPATERTNQHLDQTRERSNSTQAVVTVNGSQAIDARVRVNGGTLSITGKSLILIRLA